MNEDRTGLLTYERDLLDQLFTSGERWVLLSSLRNTFADEMEGIKRNLMSAAIAQKWFRRNPDSARGLFRGFGWGIFTLGIFLAALASPRGLPFVLTIPCFVLGLTMVVTARWLPARTAAGTAMLRQALGFRRFITESEKYRAQFAERANIFTEYLPYAVVFGATEQWAKTFESLGQEMPDSSTWYYANSWTTPSAFADSLNSFSVTSAGTLTSTPGGSGGSGFGGGAGGGGGGGGGGGW
jgi:uncharacterized membrane protein YgcG